MTVYPIALSVVLPVLYWALVIVVVGLGVAASAVTIKTPKRWLVVAAATSVVVGLLLVVLPHGHPFPAVSALLGLAVLALSVLGGGPAVLFVLAVASRDTVREGLHGGIVIERADASTSGEVLRGGTVIGIFERIATTGSIMAGFPEAIAVVVAIKSVGRFTELDVAEARERFIIGTLVSLVWAAACGGLFRFAIGL
ncbi:hypothetical protein GCM10027568_04710 [Humibacter soli]